MATLNTAKLNRLKKFVSEGGDPTEENVIKVTRVKKPELITQYIEAVTTEAAPPAPEEEPTEAAPPAPEEAPTPAPVKETPPPVKEPTPAPTKAKRYRMTDKNGQTTKLKVSKETGSTIFLVEDIPEDNVTVVIAGKSVVLDVNKVDLNGHTTTVGDITIDCDDLETLIRFARVQ
tara:strand:- start:7812 stop:8336 length:525 start_codon:yes stop_codon:yes gene_type:complete